MTASVSGLNTDAGPQGRGEAMSEWWPWKGNCPLCGCARGPWYPHCSFVGGLGSHGRKSKRALRPRARKAVERHDGRASRR
jgi:hypothetical protein